MERIRLELNNIQRLPEPSALCLGYFDGVHLGHLALIKAAKETGLKVAVLTFEDKRGLLDQRRSKLLTSADDKAEIFDKLGVDYFLVIDFDQAFMALSPSKFITDVLNALHPQVAVCGFDYRYGHKAGAGVHDLVNDQTAVFTTLVVPPVKIDNSELKISSTIIKELLADGQLAKANTLLTRTYFVNGTVVKGYGNGKKLGFPTANIALSAPYVLGAHGVYYAAIRIDDKIYYGLANIGVHPTIAEVSETLVEMYIFDFDQDIYGKQVRVYLIDFLRPELLFTSLDDLIAKMEEDEANVRNNSNRISLVV